MRALSFILIILIATSCSYFNQTNTEDYSGTYKSMDAGNCLIKISISKKSNDYQYKIEIKGKEQSGKLKITKHDEHIHFTFLGLLGVEPKIDIEGEYDEGLIIIQNYGNSMNQFTRFSECDVKYIQLVKEE